MSTLKPYPAYADTDLPWLPKIPKHWEIKPIKAFYSQVRRKGYPNKILLSVYRDFGVIPKDSRDDNFNKPSLDLSSYQLVYPRDLVLNKMKTWQGSLAISEIEGIVSPAYIICQPKHNQFDKYLHYLLRSDVYKVIYSSISYGVRVDQWDMRFDDFKQVSVVLPPLPEQRTIAAYLDRQTAKIDALIAKKQRLLDLLGEQRATLISQTVTKGLNPSVKMKDSGVAWLGQVPSHWEVKKLKSICSTTKGFAFKSEIFTDEGIPVVRASEIKDFTVLPCSTFINPGIANNYKKVELHTGDILMSTVGSKAEVVNSAVGQVAIVPAELNGALLNQNTVRLEVISRDDIYIGFLAYVLMIDSFRKYLDLHAHGTANQASLSLEDILLFPAPIPSLSEQKEVADYLDHQTKRLSDLANKIETAIARLQEYRAALISSVVTGKVDVRKG